MEPQTVPQSEAHFVSRQPYAPPTASFVPLKLEERLAGCAKTTLDPTCSSSVNLS
jgi:hypothetical protein